MTLQFTKSLFLNVIIKYTNKINPTAVFSILNELDYNSPLFKYEFEVFL